MENKSSLIKAMGPTILAAVITGIGSSLLTGFLTLNMTLAVVETRLKYIEGDLISVKDVLAEVNKNQIELARSGQRMTSIESRFDLMNRSLDLLAEQSRDRYTRTEAEKDLERVFYKIEGLKK